MPTAVLGLETAGQPEEKPDVRKPEPLMPSANVAANPQPQHVTSAASSAGVKILLRVKIVAGGLARVVLELQREEQAPVSLPISEKARHKAAQEALRQMIGTGPLRILYDQARRSLSASLLPLH